MRVLHCFVVREGTAYVSFCIDNCASSMGETPQEAARNLQEAIALVADAEREAERRGERVARVRAPRYWAWRLLWWFLYSVLRRRVKPEGSRDHLAALRLAATLRCAA